MATFGPLAKWWSEHGYGKPVYIGHAAYHLNDQWNATELSKQITQARSLDQVKGSIFFSSSQLTNNAKGWRDTLRSTHFKHMALVPPMPWIDSIPPTAPHKVSLAKQSGKWTMRWQAGEPSLDKDPAAYYVVYRIHRTEGIRGIQNAANIIYKGQKTEYLIDPSEMQSGHGFVVTAFDRLHNESPAGTIQWIVPNSN